MNPKLKLVKELEVKAKGIFGGNFISLSKACAVFGADFPESELYNFSSFSLSDAMLRDYAKDGCRLVPFLPMPLSKLLLKLPHYVSFEGLTGLESNRLLKEMVASGWYLIGNAPRRFSSGGTMLDNKIIKIPTLAGLLYVLILYKFAKINSLSEKIGIICCNNSVDRKGYKTPICVVKKPNDQIAVSYWKSQFSSSVNLLIKKA